MGQQKEIPADLSSTTECCFRAAIPPRDVTSHSSDSPHRRVRTPTDECADFAEVLPHSLLERSEWSWKGDLHFWPQMIKERTSDSAREENSNVLEINRSRNRTIDLTKDESEWQQVVFIEKE